MAPLVFFNSKWREIILKLWLDSMRPMPSSFDYHARSAAEAISILMDGSTTHISLAYGLGLPEEDSTLVARWIETAAYFGRLPRLTWEIHSMNLVGGTNIMINAMEGANRFWAIREQNETESKGTH